MMPLDAVRMSMDCDMSITSLEDAVLHIGPFWTYTVRVSSVNFADARNTLKELGTQTKYNPFAPYVNLEIDSSYNRHEWSIEASGKVVWSPGC